MGNKINLAYYGLFLAPFSLLMSMAFGVQFWYIIYVKQINLENLIITIFPLIFFVSISIIIINRTFILMGEVFRNQKD